MAHERVVTDPRIMMGKPVILRLLGQGRRVTEILDAYPGLREKHIHAAKVAAGKVAV